MTVGVTIDSNRRIVKAAHIVARFIGQPLDNLTAWMKKQGGLRIVKQPTPQP